MNFCLPCFCPFSNLNFLLLWDRIFDSPPSSPPSPWKTKQKKKERKKKKSTNSPGRGSRQKGEDWKEESKDHGGKRLTNPWEGRAGDYREERG